jgi:hypothetical protein
MIVIGDGYTQSLAELVDTCRVRYLGELAVAIVVIQKNRNGLEDVRVAIGAITWLVIATIDVIKVPLQLCRRKDGDSGAGPATVFARGVP